MKIPYQVVAYFYEELDLYKLFVEMSERNWVEEHERYTSSLEDNLEDNEQTFYRFNYRSDLSQYITEEFPQYQRKAYLIMLVSIFEDFMNQLCKSVETCLDIKIGLSDINNTGLERAKCYLSKHSPLSLPVNEKEWGLIKEAQFIRNNIAHAAGHIDEKVHSRQQEIIDRSDNLELLSYARNHLKIDSQYIFKLIEAMKVFSNKLLKECENLPSS